METPQTILLADDDSTVLKPLAIRCKNIGLEVITADNAPNAITQIREAKPDLVILDMNMPGGGAVAVCEIMKSYDELMTIPIIIMTGDSNIKVMEDAQKYQAFYVPKSPYSWQTLKPMIGRLLNISKAK